MRYFLPPAFGLHHGNAELQKAGFGCMLSRGVLVKGIPASGTRGTESCPYSDASLGKAHQVAATNPINICIIVYVHSEISTYILYVEIRSFVYNLILRNLMIV